MNDRPRARRVEFIKSAVEPAHYPDVGLPEIAVAGRSNVGKSSLINRLVNRKRIARVSNTPGRTQLLNFFRVDEFVLCDLPGYGYAKVPRAIRAAWGPMIETYLRERESLRALLLLVDIRREPGDWESELVGWLSAHGRAVVPVVTKTDKLSSSQRWPAVGRIAKQLGFPREKVIPFSSVTGEGLEELWAVIWRLTEGTVS